MKVFLPFTSPTLVYIFSHTMSCYFPFLPTRHLESGRSAAESLISLSSGHNIFPFSSVPPTPLVSTLHYSWIEAPLVLHHLSMIKNSHTINKKASVSFQGRDWDKVLGQGRRRESQPKVKAAGLLTSKPKNNCSQAVPRKSLLAWL